ncbi:MAG TPA: sulfotransferase domain-containing protein [Casimicrobiaceae bacterium]
MGGNEPCHCGSGKHYRDCHGGLDAAAEKVAFVVAGTQKGGTTALASYLFQHPEIGLPRDKEAHFFDKEHNFASAETDYAGYHANFNPAVRNRLLGDATPIYMYWESAPQRIHDYNPAMKLIMLLRNPVTRAYSHWNMEHARRSDPLPFEQAIRAEPERSGEALPFQHRKYSYIDRGLYSRQIHRIWRLFPAGQTLILKSEELRHSPQAALARITDFLGVARFPPVRPRSVHARPYEAPMSAGARSYLCEVFAPEVRTLEEMLGWDCADWLAESASR